MRPIELTEDDLERVDALASQGTSAVLLALGELPALEREAVRARVLEERDYGDLADELQCSESVVRQRVSRGLARMRRRVSGSTTAKRHASEEGRS
jgi:RNA polymerase sigma factor (sigma-70 family)